MDFQDTADLMEYNDSSNEILVLRSFIVAAEVRNLAITFRLTNGSK
jgi:hypothetical protein